MKKNDWLLFIDTNIFLDFYRIRKSDISLKYLEKIEELKDILILNSQLEIEYKKNRQTVISEALKSYTTPDWNKLSTPAIISEIQPSKTIESKKKEIITQQKKVNEKIGKILENPSSNDVVYKAFQRIIKVETDYNLKRDNKIRFDIRDLAKKRFILGYPPRKKNDNSIGDAINWEWIIYCANKSGKNIYIVTRDQDFGIIYDNKAILNDWLSQEFKQRVSRTRKIKISNKLSEAFKEINVSVTKAMQDAEQEILNQSIEDKEGKCND